MSGWSLRGADVLLVAATLAVKLAVLAIGFVGLWLQDGSAPGFVAPWDRWDAPHYTDLAVFLIDRESRDRDGWALVRETHGVTFEELQKLVPIPLRRV